MPDRVTVTTGFGEYEFTACQLTLDGNTLIIKRNGTALLWAAWPWQVIFT
jgi:hypothetical protein